MGTLYDQKPRTETLRSYLFAIRDIANEMFETHNLTEEQWRTAADVTRTALAIQSADVRDEQLASFGRQLENLIDAIADEMAKPD